MGILRSKITCKLFINGKYFLTSGIWVRNFKPLEKKNNKFHEKYKAFCARHHGKWDRGRSQVPLQKKKRIHKKCKMQIKWKRFWKWQGFFCRQSTKPVKISNLLYVLTIRERNIIKMIFYLNVCFLGCAVTASLFILLMHVFTRLR